MRTLILCCSFFLLLSCDWLTNTETRTQKLVEDELRGIDWNDVDQYPLFEACDETASKTDQRLCFERNLMENLSMSLQDFRFTSDSDLQSTVYIDFMVETTGELQVVEMQNDSVLQGQIPQFREVIIKSLRSMPRPEPALKRGIPVRSRFRLPMEITTNRNG
ncbi:hypothetical protein [Muriicola marianensis]|uniref:TonB C-terminal domain-containing protein n=1 Tax=Muriicola marianensis TaxID=1324801 RepID=A0ABQ1QUL4_9FLAO|nr:hypothetical protein [Muriicola marianensis]GGD47132.1 hypothetical protein GCM10011361_12420 [Muriicola marianensis]